MSEMTEKDKENLKGCGSHIGIIGGSLAVAMSWTAYKSIWWAVLHGACGWFYILYVAFVKHHLG